MVVVVMVIMVVIFVIAIRKTQRKCKDNFVIFHTGHRQEEGTDTEEAHTQEGQGQKEGHIREHHTELVLEQVVALDEPLVALAVQLRLAGRYTQL